MKPKILFISLLLLVLFVSGVVMADSSKIYLPQVYGPPPPPTATPTPTLGPNDITVLANYTTYVDIVNFLNIRGEIINNTGSYFYNVEILADVQDANHKQLKTVLNGSPLSYLAPGEKTCFEIQDVKPAGWKYISFEPVEKLLDTMEIPDLSVANPGLYYDAPTLTYHVTGKVNNNGAKKVIWVRVVVTAYNKDGKVIGCQEDGVSSADIGPGHYGLFDVMFSGDGYKDLKTYRIQASGSVSD